MSKDIMSEFFRSFESNWKIWKKMYESDFNYEQRKNIFEVDELIKLSKKKENSEKGE